MALADLCTGEVRQRLEAPLSNLLPEEELPEVLPRPRIHAEREQWHLIAGELYKRGLVEPVAEPLEVRGQPLLNGAFGVIKAGKYLDDERPVLRFIMDFRGVNFATRIITGDVRSLAGAASLQHIVLPEGYTLRVSADDMISAFYLFTLPPGWSKLMCFALPVPWQGLGIDRASETSIGAKVLFMGWSSAVGVLQHAHRQLALRDPVKGGAGLLGRCEIRKDAEFPDLELESSAWSLYLDDTSLLEVMRGRVAQDMAGRPAPEQERLRLAYQHWGIPVSLEKALIREPVAEKLGAVLDGERGLLRASTKRALDNLSLLTWVLRQGRVPRKALQILCGKEVHTLQFRRPLFCIYDQVWKDIAFQGAMVSPSALTVEELLMGGALQPLRFTDLRARLNEVVTASDACETGGGAVYGGKVSMQGIRDALAAGQFMDEVPEGADIDEPQTVVVFDFFAGIGGLSQALELAGVRPARLIVVEQDAECRRLNLTRWPGSEAWTDIRKVTKGMLEKVLRSVPDSQGSLLEAGRLVKAYHSCQ